MVESVFFYLFTSLMLMAAAVVVLHRQPMYSVLSLLVVMFCMAALFVLQGAFFLAAIQVLLYAGAVLVLFLFVMMLLPISPESVSRTRAFTVPAVGAFVAFWLFWTLRKASLSAVSIKALPSVTAEGTIENVGKALFDRYLLPFELTSFIILAAIIGAVTLARQTAPGKNK